MKSVKEAKSKSSNSELLDKPTAANNNRSHRMMQNQFIPSRIALFLAIIALGYQVSVIFLDYFQWATMAVGFPYPLDYGEGPLLDQTLRMAHFENIYLNSFASPPYIISPYPPLFMLVQVPLFCFFGPALWYGRLISILSVFLASFFIFLTILVLTRDWLGSVVGGLLLIAFPYVRQWSMLNRIDELALALSWAALFVTVRYVGQTDNRQLPKWGFWLASLLFVASIYTRQTYALAAPFAAVVWLIFGTNGSWRSRIGLAGKLGLTVGGTTLAMFLLLNVITGGGFYLNIVVANINSFYWQKVHAHAKEILDNFYPLLILSGLFFLIERLMIKERTRIWPLALSYLLAAGAGSVTIGKIGSNVNYLMEFCAALSLASGSALAWIGRFKWHRKAWLQVVIVVMLALQLSIIVDRKGIGLGDFRNFLIYRVANKENDMRLEQIVKNSPGIVIGDEYIGLIPLAGKRLYFEPFEFKQLSIWKVWDEKHFVNDINNRKFALILLTPNVAQIERWSEAQMRAIEANYVQVDYLNTYVLKPKK